MTSSTPEPTPPLTDSERAEMRQTLTTYLGRGNYIHPMTKDLERLLHEVDRLRTENAVARESREQLADLATQRWDEIVRLRTELEGYKRGNAELSARIAPVDDALFNAGVETIPLEAGIKDLADARDDARRERDALAAKLDQFRSFPTDPGPGAWSTSYRMGYADASRDVRSVASALDADPEDLRRRWKSATTPPAGGTDA